MEAVSVVYIISLCILNGVSVVCAWYGTNEAYD